MKNKILFSILSILGIASIFGLSLPPKEESHLPTTQSISLSTSTTTQTKLDMSTISEVVPKSKMEEGFDMGGLHYLLEASEYPSIEVSPVELSGEVETLFLFYNLYDEEGRRYYVNRNTLPTLEDYTNLKNVISLQNYCSYGELFSTIPNSISYYCFGSESMYYNKNGNIDKYYICSSYETKYTNPHASNIIGDFEESSINEIYFMDYTLDWTKPYLEDTTPITNKLGNTIELKVQSTNDSIFPKDFIDTFCESIPKIDSVDFKLTPYYSGTSLYDPTKLTYKITEINPKLKSLYVKKNYFLGEETPELDEIIWQGRISDEQLGLIHAENLIYTLNDNKADFILWSEFKTTRFYPIEGIVRFGSYSSAGYLTDLEFTIYEPTPLKEEFSFLRADSSLTSHVETYDMDDYTLKIKQFESDNGNIYYTNDESLSIDTLESYITEMTEGNFDFTTTEALDTQYQAYLETKPEVPTPTPSDNDDFVDESEFVNGYQALGSIHYTSSKSVDDILKIASNYMLQKDGKRTDEEKEVILHVDEDTLSVIIKVDGKIVASTVSKLHELDTKDYGEFIYLQNPGAYYGVLLYDTTSKTTKTPAQIYDYLLNEITNAKTIPAPDFKDFSLTTPSSVDISSSLIHTNGNTYKVEMECLSFDLSQAKDISTPDISHKQEDTPKNPDNKDKDKEETPNKDKDKEEDKNQSDVKDEGTSNIFNDFKDNFENNKTFKTMSIILGTILGLVLIYVGYRIIKKIHKWLKK